MIEAFKVGVHPPFFRSEERAPGPDHSLAVTLRQYPKQEPFIAKTIVAADLGSNHRQPSSPWC
ncbi:MAG: hypothetical protein N0E48_11750 [Candidatus Thiodiazotropha endolucinida]|nr:hypothetical protein [Candidatus Thiodiazotropha endolucinida]